MFKITLGSLLILFSTSIVSASTALPGATIEDLQKAAPKTRILSVEEMLSMEKVQESTSKKEIINPENETQPHELFLMWETLIKSSKK